METHKGPFCQSCSMPMEKPEDFGTDDRGFRVNDYCKYCYQNGKFTTPDITLEQMTEIVVNALVEKAKMPEDQARNLAVEVLPKLKRWN